jgi:very-short-patch-repair endonuclease
VFPNEPDVSINRPEDVLAKDRAVSVFRFLTEFHKLRFKEVVDYRKRWTLSLSEFPDHPSIKIEPSNPQAFLSISRVTQTDPPEPPTSLKEWISGKWKDPNETLSVKEQRIVSQIGEASEIEMFGDDFEREELWKNYHRSWKDWAQAERPVRASFRLYDKIYEKKSELQRNPDSHDLFIADGVFLWNMAGRVINHPVLLQKVEISFSADDAVLQIGVSGTDPQLFNGAVSGAGESEVTAFSQFRNELESHSDIWPLAGDETTSFFRRFANSIAVGSFSEEAVLNATDRPMIYREPMLILMERGIGIGDFIARSLENLEGEGEPTECLRPILGIYDLENQPNGNIRSDRYPDEDDTVYFTKAANEEQLKIVEQHRKNGNVVVQGPPGTGKSHTIANLIGHFLAEGKTVLVTAETTKALKVLREKVAKDLQPLCISVMESDSEGRELLKTGINELQRVIRETEENRLRSEIGRLSERRKNLIRKLKSERNLLFQARQSEFVEIHAVGDAYLPSEAAKLVHSGLGQHDWIPGTVEKNSMQPVNDLEIIELYQSNSILSPDDEDNDSTNFVNPTALIDPDEVQKVLGEFSELRAQNVSRYEIDRGSDTQQRTSEDLVGLLDRLNECISTLGDASESWRHNLVNDGHLNDDTGSNLLQIIAEAEALVRRRNAIEINVTRLGVILPEELEVFKHMGVLKDIHNHFAKGNKITFAIKMTKPTWRQVLDMPLIGGRSISNAQEAMLIIDALDLRDKEKEFDRLWVGIAVPFGLPTSNSSEARNTAVAVMLREQISRCIGWRKNAWDPLKQTLEEKGIDVALARALVPAELATKGFACEVVWLSENILCPALIAAVNLSRQIELREELSRMQRQMSKAYSDSSNPILKAALTALTTEKIDDYRILHKKYIDLHSKLPILRRRRELLSRIRPFAQQWATEIGLRQNEHGEANPPGTLKDAWRWSLLNAELMSRHQLSPNEITQRIGALKDDLAKTTEQLAKTMAWAHLHAKINPPIQAALERYRQAAQIVTGQRAPVMARAAKEAMDECAMSVPVWIMPISRVATSFNPKMKFDVVIMDEASQIGLTGLAVLQMASSAIIVGDEEQTEPILPGIITAQVQALCTNYLGNISGRELWNERMSVYRLAIGPYAGGICLLEHFRCVPEIISYSSCLAYGGKIKPLRDNSRVLTRPFVVPVRVPDYESKLSVQKKEAEFIASLLASASEQPEYIETTFGVVAMRGGENDYSREISGVVERKLGREWREKHSFHCGISPDFQGDERRIVFLAMGDEPPEPGGQLRLQTASANENFFKKRFNVAVSRAQDQLWVVSSFGLEHVQSNDIRYDLLNFAHHPEQYLKRALGENPEAESEFERLVFRDLSSKGYKLTSQFPVGKRRIDIVAEFKGKRCAIECDGEQFHGPEELENDLARQSDLERVGWKFVRIRGSKYFKDPEAAILEACAELSSFGVEPTTELETEAAIESDLVDRILIRAQQIRKEWDEELAKPTAEDEVDEEPQLDFSTVLAQ